VNERRTVVGGGWLATRLAVDLSPRLGGHTCVPPTVERSTRMAATRIGYSLVSVRLCCIAAACTSRVASIASFTSWEVNSCLKVVLHLCENTISIGLENLVFSFGLCKVLYKLLQHSSQSHHVLLGRGYVSRTQLQQCFLQMFCVLFYILPRPKLLHVTLTTALDIAAELFHRSYFVDFLILYKVYYYYHYRTY